VLSPTYARRIGITVPDDAPTRDVSIAGGHRLSVPFVRVRSVAVGPARVPDLLVGVYDIFPKSPVIDGVLGTYSLAGGQMLEEGEAAVVRPDGASFKELARLGLEEWRELAALPR